MGDQHMKVIALALLLGAIGLGIGYGIFGQINGNYVDVKDIFSKKSGAVENVVSSAVGIDDMRIKILVSGAAGGALGLVLGVLLAGKRG